MGNLAFLMRNKALFFRIFGGCQNLDRVNTPWVYFFNPNPVNIFGFLGLRYYLVLVPIQEGLL